MSKTITVFTKTVCPACKMTKRWLSERGIDFVERNIEEDEAAMAEVKALEYRSAPVVVVSAGEQTLDHWSGFLPPKLRTLESA